MNGSGLGLSPKVTAFLGVQRVDVLKDIHGENWCTAAAFEYCWLNFSHSSPAYIAAAYQFHHYITGDEFSAGYLWRDLEILAHGIEAQAVKSLEMRKKAGEKGSQTSALARKRRIASLLQAMERISSRNPDIGRLGADAVAALALTECELESPALWKQGRRQVSEYLGELRRGEAGDGMKRRYSALFPEKPLMR